MEAETPLSFEDVLLAKEGRIWKKHDSLYILAEVT
jgi:hypothetical protein